MGYYISEVEKTADNDDGIAGFYIVEDGSRDVDEGSGWTWNDCGNGPEITTPGVRGPYATYEEAEADAEGGA